MRNTTWHVVVQHHDNCPVPQVWVFDTLGPAKGEVEMFGGRLITVNIKNAHGIPCEHIKEDVRRRVRGLMTVDPELRGSLTF